MTKITNEVYKDAVMRLWVLGERTRSEDVAKLLGCPHSQVQEFLDSVALPMSRSYAFYYRKYLETCAKSNKVPMRPYQYASEGLFRRLDMKNSKKRPILYGSEPEPMPRESLMREYIRELYTLRDLQHVS